MEPVQAFAELGRINLAESSMEQVLARVSEVAKRTIPGADEVSVSLVQPALRARPRSPASWPFIWTNPSTSSGMARAWPRRPAGRPF